VIRPRSASDLRAEAACHREQMDLIVGGRLGFGMAAIKREGWAIAYGHERWLPNYIAELGWLASIMDGTGDFGS